MTNTLIIKNKKEDFHNEISHMFKTFTEALLRAELSQHLGYEKSNRSKKGVHRPNKRNGFSGKTVNFNSNNFHLKIPRDRNGTFENKLLGKYETNLGDIEEQVFSLFASGMSYENIVNTIKSIYKKEISNAWISSVTDKLLPEIEKWKSRKIENSYPILYIDGMFFNVKENAVFVKKSLYLILAIDWDGNKKALGFWIKNTESASNWLDVFSELKTRGLEDVLIISCDNLSGITQAIEAVFPQTDVQKCVVHQIRNSLLKVSNKDKKSLSLIWKRFIKRLIKNLQCKILINLRKNEAKKYPSIIKSWYTNFAELTTFFKYPYELRQAIYTTNLIESMNRIIRKNTKTKGGIQSVNYLSKITYLTLQNASTKWQKVRNWFMIKKQLEIIFPNRLNNVKLN
ncbi:IS256 family transposase [Mesomycoplasma ovipneumoniae ATCC 29419]|uniref:IS256 family transposase n=1 Tax=Mesomycoplasma ovipneumoniae TaxID=29562 RepID=UPI00237F5E58|nr:IS256 family transposase [Mesomycoplasma ovipneumoniae]WDV48621.1 IS256 family transposase [Mesomycoplasma ovipneumoniae ATCC 29419]